MDGWIALAGSGEYLPGMNDIDRFLLNTTKRDERAPHVVCVPAAAGQEGDERVNYWLELGTAHFENLGAKVTPARIIDRESANDPKWISALESADLIYFSGGKPSYLYEVMHDSLAWKAAQKAWSRGAVYAGCSAGAMILARQIPNIRSAVRKIPQNAFNIIPAKFILPHFDKMRVPWSAFLFAARRQLRPGEFIIGVDEETALVGKVRENWQVMGKGKVHIITHAEEQIFPAGSVIDLFKSK